jgi:hypothetical protein
MPKLRLPEDYEVTGRLADWLELTALLAADENAAKGDLDSAFRVGGLKNQSDLDRVSTDVFTELRHRSSAARQGYPYIIEGASIQLKPDSKRYAPYLFCLVLSYFGHTQEKGSTIFPRRMFEDISALAAKNYVGGHVYRFAAPRKDIPGFKQALQYICLQMGEGDGPKDKETRSAQDDKLDIVAWKHFPDRLSGKLILFGQCASGDDEETWDKIYELNHHKFCSWWLREPPPPDSMVKAFFVPHRIHPLDWNKLAFWSGIIFDRCRIAYWADRGKRLKPATTYLKWVRETLEKAST